MPRPKRIRNLLKSAPRTPEYEQISSSSEHSVANSMQVTSGQPSTQQRQPQIQLGQPTTEPEQQSSEPTEPLASSQPSSEFSHPPSESSQPTSQSNSEVEHETTIPKKGRQSNHYWFVDAIGKFNILLLFSFNKL